MSESLSQSLENATALGKKRRVLNRRFVSLKFNECQQYNVSLSS